MGSAIGRPPTQPQPLPETPASAQFYRQPYTASICPQHDLLLAIGIVSAPKFFGRRMAQRESWLRWLNGRDKLEATICASFVVRATGAPKALALKREAKVHGDMLLIKSVAWNETRVRGPVLSLAWWLRHASEEIRNARFIAKVDDDTYLHLPDLARLLHEADATLGATSHVYLGVLTFYHWFERLFDATQHSMSLRGALASGKWCREHGRGNDSELSGSQTGRCLGPYPFAAGYLIVLSSQLVRSIAGGIGIDTERLQSLNPATMLNRVGRPIEYVYEDAWLGSIIHRVPPKNPINYVTLPARRPKLFLELTWDVRTARVALLHHVRSKKSEFFLALHAAAQSDGLHCSLKYRLSCKPRCDLPSGNQGHDPSSSCHRWCTVEVGKPSPGNDSRSGCCPVDWASHPRASSSNCALGGGDVESSFGSDRWAAAFQADARAQLARRFKRVPAMATNTAWLSAVAAEARAAWYTQRPHAASKLRQRVSKHKRIG